MNLKKKKLTDIGLLVFPGLKETALFNGFGFFWLMFVEHQSTSGTKIETIYTLHKSITASFCSYCIYCIDSNLTVITNRISTNNESTIKFKTIQNDEISA